MENKNTTANVTLAIDDGKLLNAHKPTPTFRKLMKNIPICYLIMQAGAGVRTLHPAVTGKEGAAPAETEAVLSVLTEKL